MTLQDIETLPHILVTRKRKFAAVRPEDGYVLKLTPCDGGEPSYCLLAYVPLTARTPDFEAITQQAYDDILAAQQEAEREAQEGGQP